MTSNISGGFERGRAPGTLNHYQRAPKRAPTDTNSQSAAQQIEQLFAGVNPGGNAIPRFAPVQPTPPFQPKFDNRLNKRTLRKSCQEQIGQQVLEMKKMAATSPNELGSELQRMEQMGQAVQQQKRSMMQYPHTCIGQEMVQLVNALRQMLNLNNPIEESRQETTIPEWLMRRLMYLKGRIASQGPLALPQQPTSALPTPALPTPVVEEEPFTCRNNHPLQKYDYPAGGKFSCDACFKIIKPGERALQCGRCNYDLCRACQESSAQKAAALRQSHLNGLD